MLLKKFCTTCSVWAHYFTPSELQLIVNIFLVNSVRRTQTCDRPPNGSHMWVFSFRPDTLRYHTYILYNVHTRYNDIISRITEQVYLSPHIRCIYHPTLGVSTPHIRCSYHPALGVPITQSSCTSHHALGIPITPHKVYLSPKVAVPLTLH